MNHFVISLHAQQGDAPGYVREALTLLSTVGVVDNSDLYGVPAQTAGMPRQYAALATLQTDRSFADIQKLLARLPAIDVHNLWGRTISIDLNGNEIAALLNNGKAKGVATRIRGTAHLSAPPTVDYDAPGGAGAEYDAVRPLSNFTRQLFEAAASAIDLQPGMAVLEVGCGTGRYCLLFAERGAHVTGVDRSTTMLAHARARAANAGYAINFVHADAREGLPLGPFAAITFFMSVHYLDLTPRFWQSLRDALREGGKLAIVTLPHRHFVENEFLTRYFPSIPRIDLARFPSIPLLVRLLNEHGFADTQEREVVMDSTTSMTTMIELVERKYVSTLHLLDEQEFKAGLAAMRVNARRAQGLTRRLRATVVSAHKAQGKASPSGPANE